MTAQFPHLSRRSFLAGTLGAAGLAAAAAACSSSGGSKSGTSGDALTIALPMNTTQIEQEVRKQLATFTKQSGIKVNPIRQVNSSNYWVAVFQQLSTRLASGLPLDTAYIATEGMLIFEKAKQILEPLGPYIAKDMGAIDEYYSDVPPSLLAKFRALDNFNGNTYFLPIGYNVETVWYNRQLFSQLGIADPAPDWTWDDFEAVARKIASPPNRYAFAVNTPAPNPFLDIYPWVLTNGGRMLNEAQTACLAGSAEAVEAAAFARSLVSQKLVNDPGGSYNAFVQSYTGHLGMLSGNMGTNANIPAQQTDINKKYAIVPWPKQKQQATPVGVGGFPIFKSSANKDAVWEFIKFSISQEFQSKLIVPFANDMPIRASVATSKEFLAGFPPGTHYYTDLLPDSTMIVGAENASAVENEMSTLWEQILTGSVSPHTGMTTMQQQVNQLLKATV
jgi:multiple sugar transport system substrate-binding protein